MFIFLQPNRYEHVSARIMSWLVMIPILFGCNRNSGADTPDKNLVDTLVAASSEHKSIMEAPIPENLPASSAVIPSAVEYVKTHPDHSAYHLLFLIQRNAPDEYKGLQADSKAKVLTSALASLQFLNDWGYLDPREPFDGEAAKALVAVGKPAIPTLKALLNDKREAPLFGTEEATLSHKYKYRRADFAYRYIMLILGRQPTFPTNPIDRDKLIADLQQDLAKSDAIAP